MSSYAATPCSPPRKFGTPAGVAFLLAEPRNRKFGHEKVARTPGLRSDHSQEFPDAPKNPHRDRKNPIVPSCPADSEEHGRLPRGRKNTSQEPLPIFRKDGFMAERHLELPPRDRAAARSVAVAVAAADTAGPPGHNLVAPAAAPPGRRARWLHVLRLLLRYASDRFGHLIRLMRRNSGDIVAGEPGDARVVVVEKKTNKKEKKRKNKKNDRPVETEKSPSSMNLKNQAWMYQDPCRRPTRFVEILLKNRNEEPRHEQPAPQHPNDSNAPSPTPSGKPSTPTSPDSQVPLMVGGEPVWGEELCLFAYYCQTNFTCVRKFLCHRCIFNSDKYSENKFYLSQMLLHGVDTHKTPGLECPRSACMVRVATPRELLLHEHFCHELPPGWWKEALYKKKMKVMKRVIHFTRMEQMDE